MNVRELINQLEECNEGATVSCTLQSEKDGSFYSTEVIRTELEDILVDIIVMDIGEKGITVKKLKNELRLYKTTLPVCIKENRLKPVRFPFQIIGVENKDDIVFIKLPQLIGDLLKQ